MIAEKQPTPYELMGGKVSVQKLVDQFYHYMDVVPEAKTIRNMHAKDLESVKDKLFKFFSGWLGGPDLYQQEFGHPRLRRRHFPFAIGQQEKDQWMLCMDKALEEMDFDQSLKQNIRQALDQLATHMINA
jgi:hemoglobin